MLLPHAKESNNKRTGTLVPAKQTSPLCLPGTESTAEHPMKSVIGQHLGGDSDAHFTVDCRLGSLILD